MNAVKLATGLYRQWRVGIWESVEEIARERPDVPPAVLDLVRQMIAAAEAEEVATA